jgi:hypothetical protein
MNAGWIIFGVCVLFIVSGMIPLLRNRSGRDRTPLPPRKETLRDWRSEKKE